MNPFPILNSKILLSRKSVLNIEQKISEKSGRNSELQSLRELQGELRSTSENLKNDSLEIKERIEKLNKTEGAECPLCGQPLNHKERDGLIKELETELSNNRTIYVEKQTKLREVVSRIQSLEKELEEYKNLETERLTISNQLAKLEENYSAIERSNREWKEESIQYQELMEKLREGSFLIEVREELEGLYSRMRDIGYDAEAHTELKKNVLATRNTQKDFMDLSIAKGAVIPVENELVNLEKQISALDGEIDGQTRKYTEGVGTS